MPIEVDCGACPYCRPGFSPVPANYIFPCESAKYGRTVKVASPGLTSFRITSPSSNEGYADSSAGGPFGSLVSGGGVGGLTLDGFTWATGGSPPAYTGTLTLYVSGTSAPGQYIFDNLSFNDENGNQVILNSNGAGQWANYQFISQSYSVSGDQAVWTWIFLSVGSPFVLPLPLGDIAVTVATTT